VLVETKTCPSCARGTERKARFAEHDGSEATQILNIVDFITNWNAFALLLEEFFWETRSTRNKDRLETQSTGRRGSSKRI